MTCRASPLIRHDRCSADRAAPPVPAPSHHRARVGPRRARAAESRRARPPGGAGRRAGLARDPSSASLHRQQPATALRRRAQRALERVMGRGACGAPGRIRRTRCSRAGSRTRSITPRSCFPSLVTRRARLQGDTASWDACAAARGAQPRRGRRGAEAATSMLAEPRVCAARSPRLRCTWPCCRRTEKLRTSKAPGGLLGAAADRRRGEGEERPRVAVGCYGGRVRGRERAARGRRGRVPAAAPASRALTDRSRRPRLTGVSRFSPNKQRCAPRSAVSCDVQCRAVRMLLGLGVAVVVARRAARSGELRPARSGLAAWSSCP